MKLILKAMVLLVLAPIVLSLIVVVAAAAVVAGPMMLEKAKDVLGMTAGPNAGAEPV